MRLLARGWGMLIAGALLALAAAALQSRTTAHLAAVVLGVPVVAVVWSLVARLSDRRRGLRRVLRPATWQVDVPATVALRPTGGSLPPWSSLRERVPGSVRRHAGSRLGYAVLPAERGRVRLGPAILQRSDPFALTRWRATVGRVTEVVVWPRTEDVDESVVVRALDASSPRPHGTPQRTLEDLTVREYRRGDDLRRVHWRSSARHGELMVRHDEPTTTRAVDVALLLADAADPTTEWAVSAAASMAVALLRDGYRLRVVTVADDALQERWAVVAGDALDVFAVAGGAGAHTAGAVGLLRRSTAAGAVVVLDRPDPSLADELRAAGSVGSTVLMVDPDGTRTELADELGRAGWRVTVTAGVGPLAAAWAPVATGAR